MKNITLFIAVLIGALPICAPLCQATFLEEDFENGPPEGWVLEEPWQYGNSAELSTHEGRANFSIPEHNHFLGLNDEALPGTPHTEVLLISPKINLERAEKPLFLAFEAFFPNLDLAVDEKASVLISTDAENWSRAYVLDEFSNKPKEWIKHGVLLGEQYNGKEIFIAFQYTNGGTRNTGLCIDNVRLMYAPLRRPFVTSRPLHNWSRLTRKQYQAFQWEVIVKNAGTESLDNISFRKSLIINGSSSYNQLSFLPSVPPGGTYRDTVTFDTPQYARYRNFIILRDEEADTNLLLESTEFHFSESVLAKDDNKKKLALSFGAANPRWYGYYGTGFQLRQADTITGISVYVVAAPDSIYADRSLEDSQMFHLSIRAFEENGQAENELYHSVGIPAGEASEGWAYHELPEPLPLPSGEYLFAAGQDGNEGILGFGFDEQPGHQQFWLFSPVARGGIPWENDIRHPYCLMIRPHFKPAGELTPVKEAPISQTGAFRLWPNPCNHQAYLEFTSPSAAPAQISVLGMDGRMWQHRQLPTTGLQTLRLEHLPAGLYLLRAQLPDGSIQVEKLVKQ